MLPGLLSSPAWRSRTLGVCNSFLPATVSIEQANLGWRQPVSMQGITITEPHALGARQLLSIETVTSTQPLWQMLRGADYDLIIGQPILDCSILPSGQSRLERLTQSAEQYQEYVRAAQRMASARQGLQSHPIDVDRPDRTGPQPQAPSEESLKLLKFSAELHYLNAQVYIADGSLQVPKEVLEVVGDDLHLTAVVGRANVKSSAADMGFDSEAILDAAQHNSGVPVALAVNSEHIGGELSGWREGGKIKLRKPASARLDFTPALAKYCLSKASPLLGDIVGLEEGDTVSLQASPQDMQLPSETVHLRLEPLKLKVGRGQLLGKVLDLVQARDKALSKRHLQAATSAVHVDVTRSGAITTERLDFVIGDPEPGKGVRLVMWGLYDAGSSDMDMVLALPADTLSLLGFKGLNTQAMLPIAVSGSSQQPCVDWTRAYKALATLAIQRKQADAAASGWKTSLLKDVTAAFTKGSKAQDKAEDKRPVRKCKYSAAADADVMAHWSLTFTGIFVLASIIFCGGQKLAPAPSVGHQPGSGPYGRGNYPPTGSPPLTSQLLSFNGTSEFHILQIADIHYVNGSADCENVLPEQKASCSDTNSTSWMTSVLDTEAPDLVVYTGDQVYHDETQNLTAAYLSILEPTVEAGYPFMSTYGNHDCEKEDCRPQLMALDQGSSPNSLSQYGPADLKGIGTYAYTVTGNDGQPAWAIYVIDGGAYRGFGPNGSLFEGYDYINSAQVDWYNQTSRALEASAGRLVPAILFTHIPLPEYDIASTCGLRVHTLLTRAPLRL
ncbi:hypothetical protein WJX73_002550 [Symbiochloris irregularis]|uniref:Calcineurin-like phosphoesterase domain-containing protein n=1 Tax=Symbiochloris irregularis TaxID=706552 RepID=A0AAW1P992_9CHLO